MKMPSLGTQPKHPAWPPRLVTQLRPLNVQGVSHANNVRHVSLDEKVPSQIFAHQIAGDPASLPVADPEVVDRHLNDLYRTPPNQRLNIFYKR